MNSYKNSFRTNKCHLILKEAYGCIIFSICTPSRSFLWVIGRSSMSSLLADYHAKRRTILPICLSYPVKSIVFDPTIVSEDRSTRSIHILINLKKWVNVTARRTKKYSIHGTVIVSSHGLVVICWTNIPISVKKIFLRTGSSINGTNGSGHRSKDGSTTCTLICCDVDLKSGEKNET